MRESPAGSPVVVANLWDVTDRDIDRFARAVLETWLPPPQGAFEPCRPAGGLARVQALDLGLQDPNGRLSREGAAHADAAAGKGRIERRASVSTAVAAARGACRLPHLIGAAPVCYGLPTEVVGG